MSEMTEKPQIGDIWRYSFTEDKFDYCLLLQPLSKLNWDNEQKWKMLRLETGEIQDLYWWPTVDWVKLA